MKSFFVKNFFEQQSYQWGYRGPMIQRKTYILEKTFFSLVFFLQNIWVVWYDSSMGVQTHDDKKENKIRKKYKKGTFSKKTFEYCCYQWEYRVPILKKEKQFSEWIFSGYRKFISWKTYFEWFGKNYQRG